MVLDRCAWTLGGGQMALDYALDASLLWFLLCYSPHVSLDRRGALSLKVAGAGCYTRAEELIQRERKQDDKQP